MSQDKIKEGGPGEHHGQVATIITWEKIRRNVRSSSFETFASKTNWSRWPHRKRQKRRWKFSWRSLSEAEGQLTFDSFQFSVFSWRFSVDGFQLTVVSWELLVVSWELTVVSWELLGGSCWLGVVSWELLVVSWQLLVESWQLAVVGWQLLVKSWGISKW